MSLRLLLPALLLLPQAVPPSRPPVVGGTKHTAHAPALTPGEARASAAFNAAKALGAPELYAFLRPFPKGADLHMHLSGAVYAETFLREAAEQGLCVGAVDPGKPPVPEGQRALRFVRPEGGKPNACGPDEVPVADALHRQPLYDDLIDSLSMRTFVPTEGIDGHDQFFTTFGRFGGLKGVTGEWLDEVASRAAAQNEQYLEIMNTPPFTHAARLGLELGWPKDFGKQTSAVAFAGLRDQLLKAGLREEVEADRREFANAEADRRRREGCPSEATPVATPEGQPEQKGSAVPRLSRNAASPCEVQIRFLYQVLRAFPPQQVFAQTLLGFEVAQAEWDSGHPLVVGINFVQPEDAHLAMQDYHLQMQMLDFLHSVYPRVRVSLHAGELAFGMVPPDGLRFHIREAVELGHAERIGHGMDVLYEDDPNALLKEMARKHILVEVNLTSNDIILGKTRTDHPLAAYRAAGVPLALSTDDEGVSRIDLTHEYVKAAEEQNLGYPDLKRSARSSLEHSFLPGSSLWAAPDDFTHPVAACTLPGSAQAVPEARCAAWLSSNPRARTQWELERRMAAFESPVR